jgi:hypothetical protein
MESPVVEAASTEFVGRWSRLVSTTNWEKGRIICQWRDALAATDVPDGSCTDEAWARRVGNVSPQHVGRLRRVYQRFAETQEQYAGLYWSHFQAALEWSDAEMWLEGAVQNGWSISQMQDERRQTLGEIESEPSGDADGLAEWDEDAPAIERGRLPEVISPEMAEVHDAAADDDEASLHESDGTSPPDPADAYADPTPAEPLRPFEDLPSLPPNLAEAFEAFKLAIVHHRLAGWKEVACEDVLAALNALRQLTLAPVEA